MLHNDNLAKIEIFHKLYKNGEKTTYIAKIVEVDRSTVYRWKKQVERLGIQKFKQRYKKAKKGRKRSNKTPEHVKVKIWDIRAEFRECCGQKIRYILKERHGINLSVPTIYRVIRERYKLHSKQKKWKRRVPLRKATKPREAVQVDTVDLGDIYAFTAIDIYTREIFVRIKSRLDAQSGKEVLQELINTWGKIEHIQRDGGPEFKKEWEEYARQYIPEIRTARPYKKNEQAYIEKLNRTLRDECVGHWEYSQDDLLYVQEKVDEFIDYYHNQRPHLALNFATPSQFILCCI